MSCINVKSDQVRYSDDAIETEYEYHTTRVLTEGDNVTVKPMTIPLHFRTERATAKTGLMLVGWGGNNGTTVTAGILANKLGL